MKERGNYSVKKSNDSEALISTVNKKIPSKESIKQTTERRLSVSRATTKTITKTVNTPTTSRAATRTPSNSAMPTKKPNERAKVNNKKNENNVTNAKPNNNNNIEKSNNNKILIKPKQKTNIEKTVADMKSKFNYRDIKFSDIVKRKNGTIMIECENEKECQEIKSKLENEMGHDYDIKDIEN